VKATSSSHQVNVIVFMGVSGSGKTAVGETLAKRLGWVYHDGDDFHPKENVAKMAIGTPLTDADREPWLARLQGLIREQIVKMQPAVLSCSALKQTYREKLRQDNHGVVFVHLKGDFDTIYRRMKVRDGHYMKPEMLRSQFETLEEPEDALVLDISRPVDELVEQTIHHLQI
jgi:carbohydrate kinase (thermoresistant glucokinase family)